MNVGIRGLTKSVALVVLGREVRPRRILRGLPAGYRLSGSPENHLAYILGTFEPHLQRIIRRYVRRGDTVYDIGANIGYISLSLARQVGPAGTVFAFEPFPENLARLRENIDINRLGNVHVMDFAVWDQSGETVIRVAENSAMASCVWRFGDRPVRELKIRTEKLDTLVESGQLPVPSFIKLDVEGAEGQALRGMQQMLNAARPVIFLECSDTGRATSWELLRDLRYRCESAITSRPVRRFEDYRHSDFIWLPES